MNRLMNTLRSGPTNRNMPLSDNSFENSGSAGGSIVDEDLDQTQSDVDMAET